MKIRHLAVALAVAAMTGVARAQVVLDMPPPPPGTATAQAAQTGGESADEALARYAAARTAPRNVAGYTPSRAGYGYGYGFGYRPYGYSAWPWFGFNTVIIKSGHNRHSSGLHYEPYVPSSTRHFSGFRGSGGR